MVVDGRSILETHVPEWSLLIDGVDGEAYSYATIPSIIALSMWTIGTAIKLINLPHSSQSISSFLSTSISLAQSNLVEEEEERSSTVFPYRILFLRFVSVRIVRFSMLEF